MHCTAINCIDGRTQMPVLKFLRGHFSAFVDLVTEPGAVRVLSEQTDPAAVESIVGRVRASVHFNESRHITLVAHHDCRANPADRDQQIAQLRDGIAFLERQFPEAEVHGVWVNERWKPILVTEDQPLGGAQRTLPA